MLTTGATTTAVAAALLLLVQPRPALAQSESATAFAKGFWAQAKELGLVPSSTASQPQGKSRLLTVQATGDEEPDYTCSSTKACAIGCCGPLYVTE